MDENTFTINVTYQPINGKSVSGPVAFTIDPVYGATIDPEVKKTKPKEKKVTMTRIIRIKTPGAYQITGRISWYINGDPVVKDHKYEIVIKR